MWRKILEFCKCPTKQKTAKNEPRWVPGRGPSSKEAERRTTTDLRGLCSEKEVVINPWQEIGGDRSTAETSPPNYKASGTLLSKIFQNSLQVWEHVRAPWTLDLKSRRVVTMKRQHLIAVEHYNECSMELYYVVVGVVKAMMGEKAASD